MENQVNGQGDIFFRESEPENLIQETEQSLKLENQIPNNYIEVKLDSIGKLGNPMTLHFRNYSMEEAVDLAQSKEKKSLETLIKCLNNMIWEKFDCSMLHEKELEEIMMTIYGTFHNKELEYTYYVDDTIEDSEKLNSRENVDIACINIGKLKTVPLNENFKEPIKIKIDEKTIKFRLPRIKDLIFAEKYVDKKYFKEERELSDIIAMINTKDSNNKISYEDMQKVEELEKNKNKDLLRIIECSLLISFNDIKLEDIETKMKYLKEVDLDFWILYNDYVEKNCNFGIDPNVTFFSIPLKKEISRRFRFQSMDFIPTLGLPKNTRAVISFGD